MNNTNDNQYKGHLHLCINPLHVFMYYVYTIGARRKAWLNDSDHLIGVGFISTGLGAVLRSSMR